MEISRRGLLGSVLGGAAALALREIAVAEGRPTGEPTLTPPPGDVFEDDGSKRFLGARWPTGGEVVVENRIGPSYADIIRSRCNAWTQRAGNKFFLRSVNPSSRNCTPAAGRIVICGAQLGGQTAGITDSWTTGPGNRQMYQSVIRIDAPNSQLSLEYAHETMIHEIGHALGLNHTNAVSVMRPFVQSGANLPTAYDVDSIQIMYNQPWGV